MLLGWQDGSPTHNLLLIFFNHFISIIIFPCIFDIFLFLIIILFSTFLNFHFLLLLLFFNHLIGICSGFYNSPSSFGINREISFLSFHRLRFSSFLYLYHIFFYPSLKYIIIITYLYYLNIINKICLYLRFHY